MVVANGHGTPFPCSVGDGGGGGEREEGESRGEIRKSHPLSSLVPFPLCVSGEEEERR